MSDAWRYAVWPDPRSRSRALQSWKSFHFQKLSPLPFTMGAGNWPLILKLGHNIQISLGQIFYICPSFCVTWLWTWHRRQLQRVNHQSRTGLIYLKCWTSVMDAVEYYMCTYTKMFALLSVMNLDCCGLPGVLVVLCTWRLSAVKMVVVAAVVTTSLASSASRSRASLRWFTITRSISFQSKVLSTCRWCTQSTMNCSELFDVIYLADSRFPVLKFLMCWRFDWSWWQTEWKLVRETAAVTSFAKFVDVLSHLLVVSRCRFYGLVPKHITKVCCRIPAEHQAYVGIGFWYSIRMVCRQLQ